MRATFPFPLSKYVTGTIVVTLKISKEMAAHAERFGVGPEELENLANQSFEEIAREIGDVIEGLKE